MRIDVRLRPADQEERYLHAFLCLNLRPTFNGVPIKGAYRIDEEAGEIEVWDRARHLRDEIPTKVLRGAARLHLAPTALTGPLGPLLRPLPVMSDAEWEKAVDGSTLT